MDRKRKRTHSPSPDPTDPNNEIINPLSHSPSTLRQFTIAGLSHSEPLPSKTYPGFPHRAPRHPKPHPARPSSPATSSGHATLNYTTGSEGDDEANPYTSQDEPAGANPYTYTTEDETDFGPSSSASSASAAAARKRRATKEGNKARAYSSRVGVLTATVKRCLAEGDIPTAKWAFSLLCRAKVRGKKVDLRFERAWELGAEILMREGEPPLPSRRKGRSGREEEEEKEEKEKEQAEVERTAMELQEERMAMEVVAEKDGKREEEEEKEDKDAKLAREQENLVRVKAYYECLIQQHPYSKQHPGSTGVVVDFYAALFSAEMEGVWSVHRRAAEKVREKEENPEMDEDGEEEDEEMGLDEMDTDVDMDDEEEGWDDPERRLAKKDGRKENDEEHLAGLSRREIRLREEKNDARMTALGKMLDIAQRMDTVMETVPFSKDQELLRLRAMVSLYIGDLYVPPPPRSEKEEDESRKAKARQRKKARGFLDKIKEGGGELKEHDEGLWRSLDSDEEDYEESEEEEHTLLPMFSSM